MDGRALLVKKAAAEVFVCEGGKMEAVEKSKEVRKRHNNAGREKRRGKTADPKTARAQGETRKSITLVKVRRTRTEEQSKAKQRERKKKKKKKKSLSSQPSFSSPLSLSLFLSQPPVAATTAAAGAAATAEAAAAPAFTTVSATALVKLMQIGGLTLAIASIALGTAHSPSPIISPAAVGTSSSSAEAGLRRSQTHLIADPMHIDTA